MLASHFQSVFQYNRCENLSQQRHIYTVRNYHIYLNVRQFFPNSTSKKPGEGSLKIGREVKNWFCIHIKDTRHLADVWEGMLLQLYQKVHTQILFLLHRCQYVKLLAMLIPFSTCLPYRTLMVCWVHS